MCDTRSLAEMVKQDCLLMLTFVWYQIIGCNGETRLSARADPFGIPDHWL